MPRDLPIGNGNLLISFDCDYYLRELFFPHVGEESHTKGRNSVSECGSMGNLAGSPMGGSYRKSISMSLSSLMSS